MSLLTDKELDNGMQAGVADWVISLRPTGDLNRSMFQGVIEAQHAKTLKAVAEWEDGYCDHRLNLEGRPVDSPPKRRRSCIFCRENLLEATRQGKMPGEEK